jgi:3-oxoacyl-[acyl-carrier protein] reductase
LTPKHEGELALVSGPDRRIAHEIALKLAGERARLAINDLDAEPAAQTVADIQSKSADG